MSKTKLERIADINEEITQEAAIDAAMEPLRDFMIRQTYRSDVNMFLGMTNTVLENAIDIPTRILIPAFVLSELRRAFIMGFFIYVPFLIIDLVVASTLMSLGMMMLPPAMIAMPFKLILFIILDGWGMIVQTVMASFR